MNEIDSSIKLTLPNKIDYLDLIFAAVEFMSTKRGFNTKDKNKIKLGVEEAVTNVVHHAFEDSENQTFDIILSIKDFGLEIIIKEKGEPFDPSLLQNYSADLLIENSNTKGLGIFLMKKFMDEVSFHNLGADGKETRLIKYFPFKSINSFKEFNAKSFQPSNEIVKNDDKNTKLTNKQISFAIRLMKPEEAVDVSKCAYSAYGYSYPNPDIYFPEKIREFNKSGKMISIVAALENSSEIIGHTALKPDDNDNTAEVGVSFIKPKFRGCGCFNQLEQARIDEAKKRNIAGLYSQAVTTHPFSQKAAHKYGFKDTALFLSRIHQLEFKKINQQKLVRENLMFSFLFLIPAKKNTVYLPDNHSDIIKKIFGNLQVEFSYKTRKKNLTTIHSSQLLTRLLIYTAAQIFI